MIELLSNINEFLKDYDPIISLLLGLGLVGFFGGALKRFLKYFTEDYADEVARKISRVDERKALAQEIKNLESNTPGGDRELSLVASRFYRNQEIALYRRLYEIAYFKRFKWISWTPVFAFSASFLILIISTSMLCKLVVGVIFLVSSALLIAIYIRNHKKAKNLYNMNNSNS